MFTNKEILRIAMEQSASDICCKAEDFLRDENVITGFEIGEGAKKYYSEPIAANFISYGSNIAAGAKEEYREAVEEYLGKYEFYHCFETSNLHVLEEKMRGMGQSICFMAEYFLPDMNRLKAIPCDYETKIFGQDDFKNLYLPQWSNALCEKRKELDILGVGAFDGGKLIGLAGCSADCEKMLQIGIDVLPEYRRKGIASSLTSTLAVEILKREKVPFYCCAWSNIRSAKNAVKSGFSPGWAEMTVKPVQVVNEMNLK
ncbi:MAG: GNAT family N-acetyltransferase [Ruminococcus sp.]|nr:GNAT family N-acetyltransferase [Ruminococcus sp.]